MIPNKRLYFHKNPIFKSVIEKTLPESGLWVPLCECGHSVHRNQKIGMIYNYSKTRSIELFSPTNGMILWKLTSMFGNKRDICIGMGIP
jgi:predicted deacylase